MKPGDTVEVYNRSFHGKPIYEGTAVLVRLIRRGFGNEQEYWHVGFRGETGTYARWISPDNVIEEAAS